MKNTILKQQGAASLFMFVLLTTALIVGCGSSRDEFVFAGTALSITKVDVEPATASVEVGGTQQYTAEITLSNGSVLDLSQFNGRIAWESSSDAIASVNENGLATGQSPGTATITATVTTPQGTFADTASLTVSVEAPTLARIEVIPVSQQLVPGETATLTVAGFDQNNNPFALTGSDFTVVSNDETAATVQGLVVTGVAVGDAIVTVTSVSNASISDTAQITVVEGFTTGFESFTLGSPNGQEGWNITNASYDVEIVEVPRTEPEFSIFGGQALRLSNAVTSGSFGDWLFASAVAVPVGETRALPTGSPRNNHFEVSFHFGTTLATEQPNLQVSLSPDNGVGGRMSFLRFEDRADGLAIVFADYPTSGANPPFVTTDIATGLSRLVPHHVRLSMTVLEGPNNDIVEVYVDNTLAITGTSWEEYFPGWESKDPPITQTIILQARDTSGTGATTAPATAGEGFLFDNFVLSSSSVTL